MEKCLGDRLGFRSVVIRLRNQLGYSVFDESWAARMAISRGKVLFGLDYIDSYLGKDFVGEAVVRHSALRLRSVQDSLARHEQHRAGWRHPACLGAPPPLTPGTLP